MFGKTSLALVVFSSFVVIFFSVVYGRLIWLPVSFIAHAKHFSSYGKIATTACLLFNKANSGHILNHFLMSALVQLIRTVNYGDLEVTSNVTEVLKL